MNEKISIKLISEGYERIGKGCNILLDFEDENSLINFINLLYENFEISDFQFFFSNSIPNSLIINNDKNYIINYILENLINNTMIFLFFLEIEDRFRVRHKSYYLNYVNFFKLIKQEFVLKNIKIPNEESLHTWFLIHNIKINFKELFY